MELMYPTYFEWQRNIRRQNEQNGTIISESRYAYEIYRTREAKHHKQTQERKRVMPTDSPEVQQVSTMRYSADRHCPNCAKGHLLNWDNVWSKDKKTYEVILECQNCNKLFRNIFEFKSCIMVPINSASIPY